MRLTLTPAAGFRIAGSTVTASGVDSFAIEGSDLVLTGVQSRVLASVEFAAVDAGTPGEDGDGGTGNGSPGDGHGTDTNPGADSSPDPLATTGADGTIGWVWTGLALTLLAAGAWLFHLRRRSV